jgi:hypothetical protein
MERSRKMTQRQQMIAGHRLEGEPQTVDDAMNTDD